MMQAGLSVTSPAQTLSKNLIKSVPSLPVIDRNLVKYVGFTGRKFIKFLIQENTDPILDSGSDVLFMKSELLVFEALSFLLPIPSH